MRRRRRSWRRAYHAYLLSEKWRKKSARRKAQDGFERVRCGSKRELNVHHLTYEHVFNEPMQDLVTLCRKCHARKHGKRTRRRPKCQGGT